MTNDQALRIADEAAQRANYDLQCIPKPLRVTRLLGQMSFEISVGGVPLWLVNTSGKHAVDTVEALEEIGAHDCAGIVRRMLAFFPDHAPPEDDGTRAMQVEQVRSRAEAVWRDLADQLLGWPDDVESLLHTYVSNHEAEFRAAQRCAVTSAATRGASSS